MSPTSPPLPAAAALKLEIVALSDVGQERELNEDTVWAAPLSAGAENAWQLSGLLLVADGMGGHDAGEIASGLAGQTVRQIFTSVRPAFAPEALTGQGLLAGLAGAVEEVNRAVFAAGEAGAATGGRPGTTLTVALLRADEWAIGHVGDSRAYLIRRNGAQQLTNDDSLVAEAVRRGQMTEAEAQGSQFRNQITKAIGLNAAVAPSTYQGSWAAGEVILLCSDGLTEYVRPTEMWDAVAGGESLERACQSLIDLANQRGGHDNISVAAARFVANLNGQGAAPINGNGRKPATWPPIERPNMASAADPFVDENPRRTRAKAKSSALPWIIAGVVLALGSAAMGLLLGKRLANPAAPTGTAKPAVNSAPKLDASEEMVPAPMPAPVVVPTKAPVVPDELSIVFVSKRKVLVISAPKYKLEVDQVREKNPVTPLSNSRFDLTFQKPDITQRMLQNGKAQLRCLGPSDSEVPSLLINKGRPGNFIIKPALPGTYFLEMYYPDEKRSTRLAKIKLSKKPKQRAVSQ